MGLDGQNGTCLGTPVRVNHTHAMLPSHGSEGCQSVSLNTDRVMTWSWSGLLFNVAWIFVGLVTLVLAWALNLILCLSGECGGLHLLLIFISSFAPPFIAAVYLRKRIKRAVIWYSVLVLLLATPVILAWLVAVLIQWVQIEFGGPWPGH